MAIKPRISDAQEVDITPMIDIVFQLIIFFMVVMAIAAVYGVAIKFPAGGSSKRNNETKKPKNIVVYVQSDWIDQGHYIHRDGILKVNGKEIPLAHSDNRDNWPKERENGYKRLRKRMEALVEEGYKTEVIMIQGEMKTYHGKVMQVIDQAKYLGIDGFSLVPPPVG